MGIPVIENTALPIPASKMKHFVVFSILIFGSANSLPQEQTIQQEVLSINEFNKENLPGFTPICVPPEEETLSEPRNLTLEETKEIANKRKELEERDPLSLPCWNLVPKNLLEPFDGKKCEAQFANNCQRNQPYVGTGETQICITFPKPKVIGKWFLLKGTYGYCGADNCCDFVVGGKCNPYRSLAKYFKGPCSTVSNISEKTDEEIGEIVTVTDGVELMKGTPKGTANICIKNQVEGIWVDETIAFYNCGGAGCCRFEFVNSSK